jgi:hypothetical protein
MQLRQRRLGLFGCHFRCTPINRFSVTSVTVGMSQRCQIPKSFSVYSITSSATAISVGGIRHAPRRNHTPRMPAFAAPTDAHAAR